MTPKIQNGGRKSVKVQFFTEKLPETTPNSTNFDLFLNTVR
jgi:hypothetical protein